MKHSKTNYHSGHDHASCHHEPAIQSGSVTDPVCGMKVDPITAKHKHVMDSGPFYFCSASCLQKFQANPTKYLQKEKASADSANHSPEEIEYTCPMHPEVISNNPGSCPKCGMALEPRTPSALPEENHELKDMSLRFWISAALSLPLLAVMFEHFIPRLENFLHGEIGFWFQVLLATPVVLWGGWSFFIRGWQSIRTWNLNMFTLIAIGVGTAYVYSLVAGFFPQLFPASYTNEHGRVAVYFEAAALITVLVLLGQVLELRARSSTSQAIKALLGMAPKTARRVSADGAEEDIPLTQVHVGDHLRIRPGEKVPVDGVILEGKTSIDESLISGEPIPATKVEGSNVVGGSVNQNGTFIMEAQKVGSQTLLAQIVRMVAEAQRSRAPIQRIVDIVSSYFVPGVVAAAVITFFVWFFVGPEPAFIFGLVNAVAVLIIACPCALGLATPMSIMMGVGRGAQNGILIRDAEALEVLKRVDTLVVDKTGTLTEGKPSLTTVWSADAKFTEHDLLRFAGSLEQGSEHPLSSAIVEGARKRNIELPKASSFQSITGKGVVGNVDGHDLVIGNRKLFEEQRIDLSKYSDKAESLRMEGQGVVFVGIDGQTAGLLAVSDPIKESSFEAVQLLHQSGVRIIMLTGDAKLTAEAVARKLKIDEVMAEVLPEHKADVVKGLQAEGRIVAMAGDGVNDAPALAQAHVGIAMGTGTDVAMESAGVTLVKGDLRGVAKAIRLSQATIRNIHQNLIFAFGYNTLGIPIAAGVLFPVFGILLSPVVASAAMAFSSFSVILNAVRLKKVKI
jgi:Cu+-exporting ATPase